MKKTIICSALAILGIKANAQVEDISVTLSPTASYNWFDNKTSLDNGLMVGGRVGFGFGEYFELRGSYEKTVDVKSTLDKLDLPEDLAKIRKDLDLKSRDVKVERWGGEIKANIPSGGYLAPYITLGSGVQSLQADGLEKDEQIYVSAGLGAKINLNDRIVLNLEGKNTAFNLNKSNVLYNASGDSKFQEFIGSSKDERMYNWSVLAGLQFYLGGREPGSLSELDRAYLRKFSGGLSGLKLVVEPGGAYVDFNKALSLNDTYLVGGAVGLDFSQYVGLRAFYYQATKDKKFKKFDDLAMYGGELFARLNVARGISPYLTLGGGYLNINESSYQAANAMIVPQDSYFVKGGLGINVPVSKYFELFGAANLLYTTTEKANELQNIQKPSELKQSKMYNVGMRFNFGASSNADDLLQDKLASASGDTSAYKERIQELEKELKQAYKENDSEKAVRVIKEKQQLESNSNTANGVRLTPAELQELVSQTIDEVNAGYEKKTSEAKKEETVNQRIERLERLLLEVNRTDYSNYQKQESGNLQVSATQEILNELKSLNSKVESNSAKLSAISGDDTTIIVNPDGTKQVVAPVQNQAQVQGQNATQVTTPAVAETQDGDKGVVKSLFVNKGYSVDAGVVIGDAFAPTVGLRGHYGFTNSRFELQPSVYFGFSESSFGINANAVYKFNFERGPVVQPYLGAGVGYNQLGDDSSFGANIVVGTSFNILNGNLYFDYSALDLAKYNKISVGYKFGF